MQPAGGESTSGPQFVQCGLVARQQNGRYAAEMSFYQCAETTSKQCPPVDCEPLLGFADGQRGLPALLEVRGRLEEDRRQLDALEDGSKADLSKI